MTSLLVDALVIMQSCITNVPQETAYWVFRVRTAISSIAVGKIYKSFLHWFLPQRTDRSSIIRISKRKQKTILNEACYKLTIKFHDGQLLGFLVLESEYKSVLKSYQNMDPLIIQNIDGDVTCFDGGMIRLMAGTKLLAPQDWLKVFDRL